MSRLSCFSMCIALVLGLWVLGSNAQDTTPPNNVTDLVSTSHNNAIGRWDAMQSCDKNVTVRWTAAADNQGGTGIRGYSFKWSLKAKDLPDRTINLKETAVSVSKDLADGTKHYFHIRSVDKANNWAKEAVSIGPFFIDTTAPALATDLKTTSHPDAIGQWNNAQSRNRTVKVEWKAAGDAGSGINGYTIVWDQKMDTVPTPKTGYIEAVTKTSKELADGNAHYFHIRSYDNAGNYSVGVAHIGPFFVDATAPSGESLAAPAVFKSGTTRIFVQFKDEHSGLVKTAPTVTIKTANGTVVPAKNVRYNEEMQTWHGTFALDLEKHGAGTGKIHVAGLEDLVGNKTNADVGGSFSLSTIPQLQLRSRK